MIFPNFLLLICCVLSTMTTPAVMTSSFNTDDETILLERYHRDVQQDKLRLFDVRPQDREIVVNFSGLAFCPKNVEPRKLDTDSEDDVIPQISTCPWFWQLNYDPERQPSTIMTASCTCTHCLNSRHIARCVPVHYFRHVTYFNGTVSKLYRVAVGCTCQRPPKHPRRRRN